MKKILLLALLLTPACAHTPPNLSPQAVIAFHGTQVIGYLDKVRDAADAAHKTSPPLLDAPTTLKIVSWHRDAIIVVHAAKDGWLTATATGLNALNAELSPQAKQVLAPYIAAAQAIFVSMVTR